MTQEKIDPGEKEILCYNNPVNHDPLIISQFWGRDKKEEGRKLKFHRKNLKSHWISLFEMKL